MTYFAGMPHTLRCNLSTFLLTDIKEHRLVTKQHPTHQVDQSVHGTHLHIQEREPGAEGHTKRAAQVVVAHNERAQH